MKNEIILSKQQDLALNNIKQFIQGEDLAFVLSGSAGTGKSLLIKYITDWLDSIHKRYCLCAPTHKAALVIEQYSKKSAITLHSLLAMSPKLDILHLDFNELEFNSGESKEIPSHGIVICDEASMINDDLFDFLLKKCKDFNAKVLFVQDPCQIQPVKQETRSKVNSLENQFILTEVFRQSEKSALLPVLDTLRSTSIPSFDTSIKDEGSVVCTSEISEFSRFFISEFKKGISNSDILHTKVLAYTNDRINKYNEVIHKLLFRDNKEYHHLGFLTGYSNITRNGVKFWNSMDYIIITEPEEVDINIPNFGTLPGYTLVLYDSLLKTSNPINMLSKKISADYFESLASQIEYLRLTACDEKSPYKRKLAWNKYFMTTDSFCSPIDLYFMNRLIFKKSFDHGYAVTVHKSQGSSYNNVCIDMKDINKRKDSEEHRQLQYVALSRARQNVYIYQ